MVPMRDGVLLATDVYRPARDGVPVAEPLPVLLQRTPYGKEGRGLVERSLYFVERGYVVVLQDMRGRYESEGTFSKYHDFDAPEFVINPYPTANRFKAGHRIRIDISSSNFPRFDLNPNTGEPLGLHRRAVVADNSIHHEAAHPSHVVLPVVPVP